MFTWNDVPSSNGKDKSAIETLQADMLIVQSSIETLQIDVTDINSAISTLQTNTNKIITIDINGTVIPAGGVISIDSIYAEGCQEGDYFIAILENTYTEKYFIQARIIESETLQLLIENPTSSEIVIVEGKVFIHKILSYTPPVVYSVFYSDIGIAPMTITPDSGIAPVDGNSYIEGSTFTVQGVGTMIKTGYTFGGWFYTGGEGIGIYQEGETFTIYTSNISFIPIWISPIEYTITFVGDGTEDSGVVGNPITGFGGSVSLDIITNALGTLVKSGWFITNWQTTSFGGYSYNLSGYQAIPYENITLTASWYEYN